MWYLMVARENGYRNSFLFLFKSQSVSHRHRANASTNVEGGLEMAIECFIRAIEHVLKDWLYLLLQPNSYDFICYVLLKSNSSL